MASLKETLQAYNAKVIEKLNYLHQLLGEIAPWAGLSPDAGNSLSTDEEGGLYFKERTPEEIANAYEGLEGVERFTSSHKETLEEFGDNLEGKADLDPATGKLRTDQVPAFSITNVIRATENTFEDFLLNTNNYSYDVGDAIVITSVPDVEGNSTVSHYLYDGEDRDLSSSYSPISPNALAAVNWEDVQNVPVPVKNLSGTNTGDQDLSGIESEITDHETRIQALEAAGPSSPVDGTYANITALIADQNNQLDDFIYEVLDASDDGVDGRGYYFYNGTTVGTMDDYTSLTAQEVADLTAQAVIDALGYTPADDEDLEYKVDKVAGKQLSTEDYTTTEKSKLSGIESGATADQTGAEIKALYEAEPDTNPFTDSEKTKLSGLEGPKWKGTFLNATALETAYPVGEEGWSADVDSGAGSPARRYIWDAQDGWVPSTGDIAGETAESIKTKYESNDNTNPYTDAEKAKLASLSTTPPKEHQIVGVRQDMATVTGTQALDWNAYSSYNFTLTGATDFTDSNLPTGTDTKVATMRLTGDFGFTVPAYWDEIPGDSYDGTIMNKIVIEVINGTPGSEKVEYQIINNPA